MGIIVVLAGLILATSGYVQKKGARSRAETEIAALSAALESYKADNGVYPSDNSTDQLDPKSAFDPATYKQSSLYLYEQLSGLDPNGGAIAGAKSYFSFKPQMLGGPRGSSGVPTTVESIRDPFGNSYGYSTSKIYNPTFDLWSTGGAEPGADAAQWIKNW